MSLLSRRSKSVSNVIETPAFNIKDVRKSMECRHKACSSDNLYTGKQSGGNISLNRHKPLNFFTKFVATREKKNKKNGDSIANDEFLTKCYTKPSIPRVNVYYPNNDKSINCFYNERGLSMHKKNIFESDNKVGDASKQLFESSAILSVDDVDKNWTSTKKEPNDSVNEEKINRRRSIKGMLSSIIGWRKHTRKEKPRRFRSCDELEVGENISYVSVPMIPRARSLQIFTSGNTKDRNILESLDRSATIRLFYDRRKNHTIPQKFLDSCHLKTIPFKEDSGYGSGFFSVDESDDNLVKPSAVKEMARRLSYHPEQPWNKKNDIGSYKQVVSSRKKEKCSYRRESFTTEISDVGSYTSLDLANSNICSSPVTQKLKDEYLSVLANNKRFSAEYEYTHTAFFARSIIAHSNP